MKKTSVLVLLALSIGLGVQSVQADSLLIPRLGFTTYQDKTLNLVHEEPKLLEVKKDDPAKKTTDAPIANTGADLSVSAGADQSAGSELNALQHVGKEAVPKRKNGFFSKILGSIIPNSDKPKYQKHVSVYGDYYLYGLKQRSILYKTQGQSLAPSKTLWGLGGTSDKVKVTDQQVVFAQPVEEGLYTLSVMGSGHYTGKPFWVSDTIYWDAIKPIIRDMGQYHCPLTKGKFISLQNCYNTPILPEDPSLASSQQIDLEKVKVIKGGWFSENVDLHEGVVKETTRIARLTNLLLNLYAINPEAYEFLEVEGLVFKESPLPDIFDEASWGLKYLETAQLPNGAFPEGVRGINYSRYYELMPESPEATAYAISALTQAATLYQKSNLQYALGLLQSAVKGWEYLSSSNSGASTSQKDFAGIALKAVLLQPAFQGSFKNLSLPEKMTLANLNEEQLLQLGGRFQELGIEETPDFNALMGEAAVDTTGVETGVSTQSLVDDLVVLETRPNLSAYKNLAKNIEQLYGYEKVPFKYDPRYEMAESYKDPLAFLAFKAGQGIEKFNEQLDERNIIHKSADLPATYLEEIEKKEKDTRALQMKGFKSLTLGQMDKARLAYGLGLLSNHVELLSTGKVKQKRKHKEQPVDSTPLFKTEEEHPMEKGQPQLPNAPSN